MFKAIIVACVIGSPENCMQISDTYGPYRMEGRQTSCTVVEGEST